MKRSFTRTILIVVSLGAALAFAAFAPRKASIAITDFSSDKPAPNFREINYRGVRFSYDSSLAPSVKTETIPASVEGKPCDLWPEHPAFTFANYPSVSGLPEGFPQLRVFPIVEFRKAFDIAGKENAKSVIYPPNPEPWTNFFDKEVRILKELLTVKPQANVGRFLARARGEKGCRGAMPFLPMWEACQAFTSHVHYASFKNGSGVFFLTQWDRETEQISNAGLEYAYQGITNDHRYWVYAQFSVSAPFLPSGKEPHVMAWNEKNYLLSHQSKKYQTYLRPVLAKLEALPANQFQPNLELLDKLIQSLEVTDK
jgi:hypothetical protein